MSLKKTIRISELTLLDLQNLKSEFKKDNPSLDVEVTHDYMINKLIQVYCNKYTISDNVNVQQMVEKEVRSLLDIILEKDKIIQDHVELLRDIQTYHRLIRN